MCFCNSIEKQIQKLEKKLSKSRKIKSMMVTKINMLEEQLESIELVEDDLNKKLINLKLELN